MGHRRAGQTAKGRSHALSRVAGDDQSAYTAFAHPQLPSSIWSPSVNRVIAAVPGRAAGPQNLHVLGGASVTDIRIAFIDAGVPTTLRSRVPGRLPCDHTTGSTSSSQGGCHDPPGLVFRTRAGTRPMPLTPHLLDGRPRH
jgi:hypothetical protein